MTDKPGTSGNITARAYARSTKFKDDIVGDGIYNRMGFDLYDNENKTTAIQYLVAPLELKYHRVIPKNEGVEPYNVVDGLGDMHTDIKSDNWGRVSLDNEYAILTEIQREGHSIRNQWDAAGTIDGQNMVVSLYPEHRRAITQAGYKLTWDKPEIAIIDADNIPVVLEEKDGRRRVAAVLKIGTDDDWIEVEQKR